MENNFDKYFKNKLENRQFEMKPEFWEQAELLIEEDERKGGWRRGFIWLSTLLLVGTVGFFIWVKTVNPFTANSGKEVSMSVVEEGSAALGQKKESLSLAQTDENKDVLKSTIANDSNNQNTSDKKEISKNQLLNNAKLNNLSATSNQNQIPSGVESKSDFPKTIPSKSEDKNVVNDYTKSNSNAEGTIKSSDAKESDTRKIFLPKVDAQESEGIRNEEKESVTFQEDKSGDLPKDEKPKGRLEITFISPLNTALKLNQDELLDLDLPKCWDPFSTWEHFSFGVSAGVVGYPLIENSSPQRFIGFKAGVFGEYNFKQKGLVKKWSIGSELLYHYRTGNFLATKENVEVQYSFGRTTATNQLTPKNLHYAELPVYVKYHMKKASLELGGSFNYLAGVQGVLNQGGIETTGLIPRLGFKKYHANILFGAYYHMSNQLRFGVRANFTPGGILDNSLPNESLRESGPLYLTFRVNQYFNRKK